MIKIVLTVKNIHIILVKYINIPLDKSTNG